MKPAAGHLSVGPENLLQQALLLYACFAFQEDIVQVGRIQRGEVPVLGVCQVEVVSTKMGSRNVNVGESEMVDTGRTHCSLKYW